MIRKPSSTAFRTIIGSLLIASVIVTGCNNGEEKKETPPADTTAAPAPAPAPAPDTTAQPVDTAATKPVGTPN